MKKSKTGLIILLFWVVIGLCMFYGCSKGDDYDYSSASLIYEDVEEDTGYRFINPEDFFNLDYTPEIPEKKSIAGKITDSSPSGSGGKDTSIIPGVRELSKYKIKYASKRLSAADLRKAAEQNQSSAKKMVLDEIKSLPPIEMPGSESLTAGEAPGKAEGETKIIQAVSKENESSSTSSSELVSAGEAAIPEEEGAFIIKDWGPKYEVPGEISNPQFYIEFSHPVKPLAALDEPASESDIMSITPPLKGVFRWYGSRNLSFEASEDADSSQVYTITVNSSVKSLGGKILEGERAFSTKAAALSIEGFFPGQKNREKEYYNSSIGLPKEIAKSFAIRFNYLLSEKDAAKVLSISEEKYSSSIPYTAVGEFTADSYVKVSADKTKTNTFYVTIQGELHNKSTVYVNLKNEKGEILLGSNEEEYYYTLKPFVVLSDYKGNSSSDYKNMYIIKFNQSINEETVMEAVSIPDKQFTSDNFNVEGNCLHIFNLDLSTGETYTINISTSLKNAAGYNLSAPASFSITVPEYSGYAKFIDSGTCMMEAQFPHKILFEYMNASPGSVYEVRSVTDPLNCNYWDDSWNSKRSSTTEIDVEDRNTRQFVEIDLDPYLNDGKGFIRFDADILTQYYNYYGALKTSNNRNAMTVQVTDLGVTMRLGINKAVVMVRSLSTNEPVKGASVSLYTTDGYSPSSTWNGVTDENGLAVLDLDIDYFTYLTGRHYNQNKIAVLVQKDNDKATFYPNNHSSWTNGVSTDSMRGVFLPQQRTFMFCDRGLYKPEETVTFRGIDRNQEMGSFIPYNGGYTVRLAKYDWSDRVVYEEKTGTTSTSGGFWGSFTLPEDIEPGTYRIEYQRDNSERSSQYLYFTVAYFERVKYQALVTIPEKVYYTGDIVYASLEASYLGGGKLSNAEYDSTWYSEPWPFYPESETLRKYTFGINTRDAGREYVQNDYGNLSNDGTAELSCETYAAIEGSAYLYKVEAEVTDESNQNITAAQTVLIHPAQFYMGVGKPLGSSGFAKKNQKLVFPYIFVNPQGEEETSNTLSAKLAGSKKPKVKVELTREYWTVSYQNSVNSSVYARYNKNTDTELVEEMKFDEKGTFTITPENSGYYTLRLSTSDKNNNTAVTEYSFYVTGSDSYWWSGDTDSLSLTPDQSQYNPGDTAQLLLQSPLPSGDYLITVEREGIFTEEIRHLDSPSSVIEIPIARNYVPVVYVSVSSYSVREGKPTHEYGEEDLGKPKGYYGVTPLFINPYVRAFSVDVACDKSSYCPGDTAVITLTATKGGKPLSGAELTVMGVDRGVLDLINYHVPNPIDFFYNTNNFPLRVRGGDSRALLMDPVTYSIKSLQGGDSDEDEKDEERKDFRPTAFFEPALITGADGTVTCSFVVPDSLTTFRVTVFGVKDELLALQEDEFQVKNPINVQSVQPRRLRVRDTAECGVLITNLDSKSHEVSVSVNIRAPQNNTDEDEEAGRITVPGSAFIDGPSSHTITVGSGNSSVVYFDVGAEKQGTVELVYTIQSDILNEKLVSPVLIEKTYVMETVALTGSTSPVQGGKTSVTEGIVIPSFAEDGEGSLNITLDPTRLGLLSSAVDYVFKYPYGCLEQQTSQVLPLVLFEDYIDVFGFSSEVSNVHTCVKSFFKSWKKEQQSSGGFPYWPGGDKENYYVSLRIAHIYAAAKKNGYSDSELSIDIKDLKSYLQREQSSSISDYMKAYSYYVFALLDDHGFDSDLENFTKERKKDLSVTALAGLAWSLKDTSEGKMQAQKCADYIRSYMRPVTRSVDITQPTASGYRGIFYNQRSEQMALIMQLFAELNPQDEMVDRLLFSLLSEQANGYWTNTAVTARVMEAVDTLIKVRNLESTDFTASAVLNNTEFISDSFKGLGSKPVQLERKFLEQPVSDLTRNVLLPLTFNVEGTGTLFYTAQMQYALPDEMQSSRDEGIAVSFRIIDQKTGEVIKTDTSGVYTIMLESGKTYNYELTIKSTRDCTYLAVRSPLPSGAVAVDNTFVTTGSGGSDYEDYDNYDYNSWVSNKTIYDNEVRYFWDTFYKGETVMTYSFRASRRGIYPVTPVLAECMYEPEIFGRSDGYLFIIK